MLSSTYSAGHWRSCWGSRNFKIFNLVFRYNVPAIRIKTVNGSSISFPLDEWREDWKPEAKPPDDSSLYFNQLFFGALYSTPLLYPSSFHASPQKPESKTHGSKQWRDKYVWSSENQMNLAQISKVEFSEKTRVSRALAAGFSLCFWVVTGKLVVGMTGWGEGGERWGRRNITSWET